MLLAFKSLSGQEEGAGPLFFLPLATDISLGFCTGTHRPCTPLLVTASPSPELLHSLAGIQGSNVNFFYFVVTLGQT